MEAPVQWRRHCAPPRQRTLWQSLASVQSISQEVVSSQRTSQLSAAWQSKPQVQLPAGHVRLQLPPAPPQESVQVPALHTSHVEQSSGQTVGSSSGPQSPFGQSMAASGWAPSGVGGASTVGALSTADAESGVAPSSAPLSMLALGLTHQPSMQTLPSEQPPSGVHLYWSERVSKEQALAFAKSADAPSARTAL